MKPILTSWTPLVLLLSLVPAQTTEVSRLPIKELTAFKDGHAFVLRSGMATLPADRRILLDQLPTPVLGTFWPTVTGEGCSLRHVTAGHRAATRTVPAHELHQLLAANLGADIIVRETGDIRYPATIVSLVTRPTPDPTPAPWDGSRARTPSVTYPLPTAAVDMVLLKTQTTRRDISVERVADDGTRLVRLDRIVDVTFVSEPRLALSEQTMQPHLMLDVHCSGAAPEQALVSLAWVERGFRWIPGYRLVTDGKGKGTLKLQATLVNDLADMENATVHLVVGVPSFAAKDQVDPMALQAAVAQAVSQIRSGQTPNFYSNAMMSQIAGNAPHVPGAGTAEDSTFSDRAGQDLHVFTVEGITLKAGERMVLTISEIQVDYTDIWKLDVLARPPQEGLDRNPGGTQELARLMAAPKVRHELRIKNTGRVPFTTAPALVLAGDQVLAQGTITYTPPGQSCDLELTTAVNLLVRRVDNEVERIQRAERWNQMEFLRIHLEGSLYIANRSIEPVEIEVRRSFFGRVTEASADGKIEQLSAYESDLEPILSGLPWRSFPWFANAWWHALNGIGRVTWTVRIPPGEEVQLNCKWHYHWR